MPSTLLDVNVTGCRTHLLGAFAAPTLVQRFDFHGTILSWFLRHFRPTSREIPDGFGSGEFLVERHPQHPSGVFPAQLRFQKPQANEGLEIPDPSGTFAHAEENG